MINKYPFQYQLEDGSSVTVNRISNTEYQFNIILPNGSADNFTWYTESHPVNSNLPEGTLDSHVMNALVAFWQMTS